MKRVLLIGLFCLLISGGLHAAPSIVGFWKSIDDKTNKPQSIVAIYEYKGKCYGRLIATYNPQGKIDDTIYNPLKRAPGVQGDPYYVGLDFIWNLKKDGNRYVDGEIMDPEKGRIYSAKAWREGNDLIIRGEIFFIGRNQKWPPATDNDFPAGFQKPDLATLVPKIPKTK